MKVNIEEYLQGRYVIVYEDCEKPGIWHLLDSFGYGPIGQRKANEYVKILEKSCQSCTFKVMLGNELEYC